MTLDFSKFPSNAVQVSTSAGKLWLYPQRDKDLEAFGRLPADVGPRNRLRSFLPCVASRVPPDDGDRSAPGLDIAWCQQLSDEDLELIAHAYLSSASFHSVTDDGDVAANRTSAAAEESAIEHLDRLLAVEDAIHREEVRMASELFREQFGSAFATLPDDADKECRPADELASRSDHDQRIAPHPTLPAVDAALRPEIADESGAALTGEERRASGSSRESDDPQEPKAYGGSVFGKELDMTDVTGNTLGTPASPPSDVHETSTPLSKEPAIAAAGSDQATRGSPRIALTSLVLSAVLVAVVVIFSVERYIEEKRNNQAMSQWQESISQMIKDSEAAQERRLKLLDEKLVELSARRNALEPSRVAAVPEVAPPPKRAPGKTARSARTKRSARP